MEHVGLTVGDVDTAVVELRAYGAEISIEPLTRDPSARLVFIRGPKAPWPSSCSATLENAMRYRKRDEVPKTR